MKTRTLVVTWCSDMSGPHDRRAVVTLVQTEAPGDDKSGARYDVRVGEKAIGSIHSYRTESWRKAGRIRTSLIGRPLVWSGDVTGQFDSVRDSSATEVVRHVCSRAAGAGLFTPETIGKGKKS